MRVSLVVILLLLLVPAGARAQEPAPPPLDGFLEQRVAEELAADGVLLSRLGVTLEVEAVGDKLLVSLVDVATGRVSASTKVDDVPEDRDAAVASLTQVVANMVTQIATPAEAPSPAPARPPADDDRDLAAAEYQFRQEAIGFGNELLVFATPRMLSVSRRWTPYQGELRVKLEGPAFYDLIGRPDLSRAYRKRRTIAWSAAATSLVAATASFYFTYKAATEDCFADEWSSEPCPPEAYDRRSRNRTAGLVTGIVGLTAAGVAGWYFGRPHPISEGEAKRLVVEHNRNLRARLGLPTQVTVSPYLSADGAGLALGGGF